MKTVRYNDKLKYGDGKQKKSKPMPEAHACLVEIAERFYEIGQERPTVITDLWRGISYILRDSDTAFWLLWDALRSESEWQGASYSALAVNRGCTKQAIHQRLLKDLDIIANRRPDLAEIIRARISKGDRRQGGVA